MASKTVPEKSNKRLAGMTARVAELVGQPYTPIVLAWLGGLVYFAQTWTYAFSLRSILDEGLYLVKGLYFARGEYIPFQDYGVLTNHMPLSFLIPGWVQEWFGPGLRTGRYYAVFMGLLMLAGLWLAARRVGGKWWAAFAVWAVALNVALVKIYSVAFSQVLVAALAAWALATAFDPKLDARRAALAGGFAGALLMTRINLAPLAVLLVLYLYWRHGKRLGSWALLGAMAPILILHALYWPGILRMWASWLPGDWLPFLEPYTAPWRDSYRFIASPFSTWIRDLDDITWNPISSFWDGVRFNFVAIIGVLANLLLWPGKAAAWSKVRYKTAVFLNLSFLVLLGLHMWAALSGRSCHIFCFSGYVGFFNGVGLLALAATAPFWRRETRTALWWLAGGLVLVIGLGVGYGAADSVGLWLVELRIPFVGDAGLPLWGLAENKYGMDFRTARQLLPAIAGLSLAALGLVGVWLWRKRQGEGLQRFAYAALLSLLVLGFVAAPSPVFGGGDRTLDCGGNVVADYERVGAQVRQVVPPGSVVYYAAANSPILLLYLSGAHIYPPQLNNVFSFSDINDPVLTQEPLRFGLWNQELRDRWSREADIILLEGRHYEDWQAATESGVFNIVLESEPVEACRGKDSQVIVLERY